MTVHTVMTRLAAKGLVSRAVGRRGAWLTADPADQAARLMAGVLLRGPEPQSGAAAFRHHA